MARKIRLRNDEKIFFLGLIGLLMLNHPNIEEQMMQIHTISFEKHQVLSTPVATGLPNLQFSKMPWKKKTCFSNKQYLNNKVLLKDNLQQKKMLHKSRKYYQVIQQSDNDMYSKPKLAKLEFLFPR